MPCSTPCFVDKKFPATVATVKCPSDHNICGHSYNCLTFNGCVRLDKIDFQRPAAKKGFRHVPCLEYIIIQGEVAFDAARFHISPVLSKEEAFADIHKNVGLVRSILI